MKALLTIDEVCEIAGVSKPTVYRKVKLGEFPAPTKVPTTATRGPKLVNRWKKGAVLDHVKAHSAADAAANPPIEDTDTHWYEYASPVKTPWTEEHKYSIMAVIGGLLAGLAVWIFK
tara:strand:+ start:694 stop:1044 length:351 start_codon:yes stop_codon:yes gene_type:complete